MFHLIFISFANISFINIIKYNYVVLRNKNTMIIISYTLGDICYRDLLHKMKHVLCEKRRLTNTHLWIVMRCT